METLVTTTITGEETVSKGQNIFDYEIKAVREDEKCTIYLYIIFNDSKECVNAVVECSKQTFEENYIEALERASVKWNRPIKEVA